MLRGSHLMSTLDEVAASQPPGRSVAAAEESRIVLTDKLSILVRVDLDDARAQVSTKGHVTVHSIHALYVVVKRANALRKGLNLELDMRAAYVDPDALQQLRDCSKTRHLPAIIDPLQEDCTFSILPPLQPAAATALHKTALQKLAA
ncbi:hypothetical protein QFZ40_000767 [Arthrobacter pascens]|nr:hypothetical protein [Arthrobacter pascens]